MRDISFRAWDTVDKKMIAWDPSFFGDCVWGIGGERYIDMQFTGILGHNSREVYEGDICKFAGTIGVFKWDDMQWKVFNKEGSWMPLITLCTPEIIGNIHENPELLTK